MKGALAGEGAVGRTATRRLPCSACSFLLLWRPGAARHLSSLPGPPGEEAGPAVEGRGGAVGRRGLFSPGQELAGGSLAARHSCTASAGARAAAGSGRPLRPPPASSSAACLPPPPPPPLYNVRSAQAEDGGVLASVSPPARSLALPSGPRSWVLCMERE